jgi:hypothetical protein
LNHFNVAKSGINPDFHLARPLALGLGADVGPERLKAPTANRLAERENVDCTAHRGSKGSGPPPFCSAAHSPSAISLREGITRSSRSSVIGVGPIVALRSTLRPRVGARASAFPPFAIVPALPGPSAAFALGRRHRRQYRWSRTRSRNTAPQWSQRRGRMSVSGMVGWLLLLSVYPSNITQLLVEARLHRSQPIGNIDVSVHRYPTKRLHIASEGRTDRRAARFVVTNDSEKAAH